MHALLYVAAVVSLLLQRQATIAPRKLHLTCALRYLEMRILTTAMCHSVLLQLLPTTANTTDTHVRFPAEMPVTTAGFRAPSWQAGTTLQEYCSAVQQSIAAPWQQRRALVQALAAACGMLEYDAADFSSAHIFVQVCKHKCHYHQ
jgi:hypothetical protein